MQERKWNFIEVTNLPSVHHLQVEGSGFEQHAFAVTMVLLWSPGLTPTESGSLA